MGKLEATKEELQELAKTKTCEQIGKVFGCSAEFDPKNAEVLCPKCHRASHD